MKLEIVTYVENLTNLLVEQLERELPEVDIKGLRKQLSPLINKFGGELVKLDDKSKEALDNLEKALLATDAERKKIAKEAKEKNDEVREKKDTLILEINKYKTIYKETQEEKAKVAIELSKAKTAREKAEASQNSVKGTEKALSDKIGELQEKISNYAKKTELLAEDCSILKKRETVCEEKEEHNLAVERANTKIREATDKRQEELDNMIIDIKIKSKETNKEYKKLKLDNLGD